MDEELNGKEIKEIMDTLYDLCEEQYMKGYTNGFQQGRMIEFEAGTKKAIKER